VVVAVGTEPQPGGWRVRRHPPVRQRPDRCSKPSERLTLAFRNQPSDSRHLNVLQRYPQATPFNRLFCDRAGTRRYKMGSCCGNGPRNDQAERVSPVSRDAGQAVPAGAPETRQSLGARDQG
jgi:hypothetical protein